MPSAAAVDDKTMEYFGDKHGEKKEICDDILSLHRAMPDETVRYVFPRPELLRLQVIGAYDKIAYAARSKSGGSKGVLLWLSP